MRPVRNAFALALLALAPVSARAQQPQPFTNTSDTGVRVESAFPSTDPMIRVRFGAAGGSGNINAGKFDSPQVPGSYTGQTQATSATQLGSEVAASGAFSNGMPGFEAFFSLVSFTTTLASPPPQDINFSNPAYQWGDATIGARYVTSPNDQVGVGGEAGATILGGAPKAAAGSTKPGTGLLQSGGYYENFFVRGMASYRPTDALVVSANLGIEQNDSWDVWKAAFAQANPPDRDVSQITAQERLAYGIYGKNGAVTRPMGGLSLVYGADKIKPFGEVSFESTAGDLGLRVSPGISWSPASNLRVVGYADIAASGAPKSSPAEPPFRLSAGLQYAFGAPSHVSSGGGGHRGNDASKVKIELVNETGAPVSDARLLLVDAAGRGNPGPPVPKSSIVLRRDALGQNKIGAVKQGYTFWPPARWAVATDESIRITLYSAASVGVLRLDLKDERGGALPAEHPLIVRVSPADGPGSVLGAKTFNVSPNKGPVDFALPVNPAGWTLEFSDSGVPFSSNLNARVEGGKTSPVPAFLDLAAHRLFATQPQLEAIVTIQPAQLTGLFDSDLAELKPAAAKALDEAVNAWKQNPTTKVLVTVHAKKGTGDPLFLTTLANARFEAIKGYFTGHGVDARAVVPSVSADGPAEEVKVEVK